MRFIGVLVGIVFLVALGGGLAQAQQRAVFTVEESAIECFEVIGGVPEFREISRRTSGRDHGPMSAFVVQVGEGTAADIRATFTDIIASQFAGFEETRRGATRLAVDLPDDITEAGGTTQYMPRDGFVMFTMSAAVVDHLRKVRPRCGAQAAFDRKPFVALQRHLRSTLRGMLDQEQR